MKPKFTLYDAEILEYAIDTHGLGPQDKLDLLSIANRIRESLREDEKR